VALSGVQLAEASKQINSAEMRERGGKKTIATMTAAIMGDPSQLQKERRNDYLF